MESRLLVNEEKTMRFPKPMPIALWFYTAFMFGFLVHSETNVWAQACEHCAEPNCANYLVCEDWDVGTPPDQWPTEDGETWHGWTPASYGNGTDNDIVDTTDLGRPNNRCLMQYRSPGENDCLDLSHSIPDNDGVLFVRFYLYLPSSDYPTIYYRRSAHFLFLHSASGAQWALDIDKRSEVFCQPNCPYNEGYSDPDHQGNGEVSPIDGQTHGYEWFGHMMLSPTAFSQKYVETEGVPFFLEEHLDEWILVEWMIDIPSDRTSLWLNETPYVLNANPDWNPVTLDSIIFSGFSQIPWSMGAPDDIGNHYFIDDIVVSTSYIGPRNSTTTQCSDNQDNDGDGQTDFPDDTGCSSPDDDDESDCGDGVCEGGETIGSCPADCGTAVDGGTTVDGGVDGGSGGEGKPGGCGCRNAGGNTSANLPLLVLLLSVGLLWRRLDGGNTALIARNDDTTQGGNHDQT